MAQTRTPAPGADRRPPTFDRLAKKQPLSRDVRVVLDDAALRAYEDASDAAERARARLQVRTGATDAQRTELEEAVGRAEAELAAAAEALEAETVVVKLRSIGRRAYEDLVQEHQPTEAQVAEFRRALEDETATPPYDAETFPLALISASAREPRMTPDDVAVLYHGGWYCGGCGRLLPVTVEACPAEHAVAEGDPSPLTKLADTDEDDRLPAWNPSEFFELFTAAMDVNTQRRVAEQGKGRG
jgi:hypothetical protein